MVSPFLDYGELSYRHKDVSRVMPYNAPLPTHTYTHKK